MKTSSLRVLVLKCLACRFLGVLGFVETKDGAPIQHVLVRVMLDLKVEVAVLTQMVELLCQD